MTFESAVKAVVVGRAVKRPSMRGYITKSVEGLNEEQIAGGQYALVVVEADGKITKFPMCGMKPETGENGKEIKNVLVVNADFLEAILADDWMEAPVEDYEAARVGGRRW